MMNKPQQRHTQLDTKALPKVLVSKATLRRSLLATTLLASTALLSACSFSLFKSDNTKEVQTIPSLTKSDTSQLQAIASAQPENIKERYAFRHPLETLSFFGIKPGDTVVEVLPGGGWYSRILAPYLGASGKLIGIDYDSNMWPHFGGFATPEFIASRKNWSNEWKAKSNDWHGEHAAMQGFDFSSIPPELSGTADSVLYIRAMHNLSRFNKDGAYLEKALAETFRILKPGGIVGIVQHGADESLPDDWAQGQNGYLKVSAVKDAMANAGFKFVSASDINANAKDKPNSEDFVWRLPPSLSNSKDKPELRESYKNIGESNRMTLVFQKPRS